MATAAALRKDLESGRLPKLCAKTGAATETTAGVRLTSAPGWTWVLILFGIVPFVIVRWLATKSVRGRVPVSQPVPGRARTTRWMLAGVLALGIALLFVALAGDSRPIMWIGLVIVVVALVAMTGEQSSWWIDGQVKGDWVWLRGVHPTFARALGEQYHELPPDRRPR